MRKFILLLALTLVFSACGVKEKEEPAAVKKEQKVDQPVDLGDPAEPLEIRALKGAKQVKKQIETQEKENSKVLDQDQ